MAQLQPVGLWRASPDRRRPRTPGSSMGLEIRFGSRTFDFRIWRWSVYQVQKWEEAGCWGHSSLGWERRLPSWLERSGGVLLFSHWVLFNSETSWTGAHQAPLSMGVPRQEYWSRLPFPTSVDLPHPGIKPASLASPSLASGFLTTASPGKVRRAITQNSSSHSLVCGTLEFNETLSRSYLESKLVSSHFLDSISLCPISTFALR